MSEAIEINCDLLVVGAGIYGAWTAYDAALRGLKVLIIDKGDIASGTSSASSKLIHGGLRYLEQFNFSLVRKSATERQRLLELAPHMVHPLRFGVPLYEESRVSSWKFKIGLWLYDWLADFNKENYKHESLANDKFVERFPFVKKTKLKKGFTYLDARTDDARYTLEIIDGAVHAGAELKTYCALSEYKLTNNKVSGALLTDTLTGESLSVKCKAAVNATGRYTDSLLNSNNCRLSKGVHIIMPKLETEDAMLLLSPKDGRVFFTIPWYGRTMVGTTDTDYDGDLNNVTATQADKEYLLESVNYFLEKPWTIDDIIASFAGLRVLKKGSGNNPSSVKRDWEFKILENGLYVSAGGKYTSAREDCSKLVNKVCQDLNIDEKGETERKAFPWAPQHEFESWQNSMIDLGQKLQIRENHVRMLISRQGVRAEYILNSIQLDNSLSEPIIQGLSFTKAEWIYVLKNEYCKCFKDLIRRRFPITLLKSLSDEEEEKLYKKTCEILDELELKPIKK